MQHRYMVARWQLLHETEGHAYLPLHAACCSDWCLRDRILKTLCHHVMHAPTISHSLNTSGLSGTMGRCASECLYISLQAPGTAVPLHGGKTKTTGCTSCQYTAQLEPHKHDRTAGQLCTHNYRRHSRKIERVAVTFNNSQLPANVDP